MSRYPESSDFHPTVDAPMPFESIDTAPKNREIVITLVGKVSDYVLGTTPAGQAAVFRLVDAVPPISTDAAGPSSVHYGQLTDSLDARTPAQRDALAAAAQIRAGVEQLARINRNNRTAREKK